LKHQRGGKRIQRRSTGTANWDEAIKVAIEWIRQQYIDPSEALNEIYHEPESTPANKNLTIREQCEIFLVQAKTRDGLERARYTKAHYASMMHKNLLVFCDGYTQNGRPAPIRKLKLFLFGKNLDGITFEQEWINSWKRLPRGKGDKKAGAELTYQENLYMKWRTFLGFCVTKEWLDKMPPKVNVKPNQVRPPRGLKEHEMQRVMDEVRNRLERDPRGYVQKGAQADLIITELLIENGVRISEGVTLAQEDIVAFKHPNGQFMLNKVQWKHRDKKIVKPDMVLTVPLSDDVVEKLEAYRRQYGYAGTDHPGQRRTLKGKVVEVKHSYPNSGALPQYEDYHYFFWNPQTSEPQPRINQFGRKIRDYVILAQKPTYIERNHAGWINRVGSHSAGQSVASDFMEPFAIPEATAHHFRHGLAKNGQLEGRSLEQIKIQLGHSDIRSTQIYAEKTPDLVRQLGQFQKQRAKKFNVRPEPPANVVPIKGTKKTIYSSAAAAKSQSDGTKAYWEKFRAEGKTKPNSSTGVWGVGMWKGKFKVQVSIDGKNTYLGCYDTLAEATKVRDARKRPAKAKTRRAQA
jgi:integrase